MSAPIHEIESAALAEIAAARDESDVEALRVRWLGRKSPVLEALKQLAGLSPDERREAGRVANDARQRIEAAVQARADAVRRAYYDAVDAGAAGEGLDVSLPGTSPRRGAPHPITTVQREIEGIFTSMGFAVLDGPEVEDDLHNFTALNIPADHPARDMQDTYFTADGNLLRTHTSTIQVRAMIEAGLRPPFRVIGPGRVFRNEAVDASHETTFYQVEGMLVDRDVSVANLIAVMKTLLSEVFRREVTVRLRPGFFPFVEPGFELDIRCLICGGDGCAVCKHSGWVELLPCGLVHPAVLRAGGIDSAVWSGFAFGLGLNRLVMMRYGIDDIRRFLSGDIRFSRAFL